jgi:hypothetical protein
VGTTLVPLDAAEVWALSDRLVCSIALNPLLSQYVSDEKRERQTPSPRVLSHSMVHSFAEFVNLSPYDLGNGAPKASVEHIEGIEENVPPLCLMPQRTHVPIKHHVNEPKISRNLCFTGCIPVLVYILPFTHVGDDVLEGEHEGAIYPSYIRLRRLVTALQNGCYIGYGHLHVSAVDGRDKNIWLAAIVSQMLIKSSDHTLICGGGDGLKQPLQTPALQFLDCPTCSIIIGELLFDGKNVLQNELLTLKRRPGYHGSGPRGLRSRTLPSRHAGGSLGLFVEQLVCTSKTKGLKTPSQINSTPYKNTQNQPNKQVAQSVSGVVP